MWQCSEDMKIEFGILKCAAVSPQREKSVKWENSEETDEVDIMSYKIVDVLELNRIMDEEMKKMKEVYHKIIMMLMKSHPNGKNLFFVVNIWTVSIMRYITTFLDWTKMKT